MVVRKAEKKLAKALKKVVEIMIEENEPIRQKAVYQVITGRVEDVYAVVSVLLTDDEDLAIHHAVSAEEYGRLLKKVLEVPDYIS